MSKLINSRTGGVVSMITFDGYKYKSEDIKIDNVSELLGRKGMGGRQKEQHEREREEHNRFFIIEK